MRTYLTTAKVPLYVGWNIWPDLGQTVFGPDGTMGSINLFLAGDASTAIVKISTDSGFIIAADGRQCFVAGQTRTINSETEQKIFPVLAPGRTLACALMGSVSNADKSFDLATESRKTAALLCSKRFKNLHNYAEAFARLVKENVTTAREDGRLGAYQEETVAKMILAGYFRGERCSCSMTFAHHNQILCSPIFDDYSRGDTALGSRFWGSEIVGKLVFKTDDQRFAPYRGKGSPNRSTSLSDAAEIAGDYIKACSESADIDPCCAYIGGHIHIAKITPANGFEWVIPPRTGNQAATCSGC